MPFKTYFYAAIALCFFLLLGVLFVYQQQLKVAKIEYLNSQNEIKALAEQHAVDMKIIKVIRASYARRDKEARLLQQRIQEEQAGNKTRQQKIIEVHHEAVNKSWADTVLPADIIRLRNRPAIADTRDYRQYVQRTNPMCAEPCKPKNQL